MRRGKPKGRKKKTSTWTPYNVLMLILGVLGVVSLVELRTQIQVTPLPALKNLQAFSVPFLITNAGYLSFKSERTFCYLHRLEIPGFGTLSSGAVVTKGGNPSEAKWGITLERGGSETILCNIEAPLKAKADIAIVVDYRPFGCPRTLRHYERFVGESGDSWQWVHQPMPDEIREEADDFLKKSGLPTNR